MSVIAGLILVTILVLGAAFGAVLIYALVRMTKERVPFDFSRPAKTKPTSAQSEVPRRE